MIVWIVLGVIALLLGLMFVGMYNGLINARNQVRNGWSQIDVQLKRRHDLIPNLVETVKGYAGHEKDTLDRVVKARSQAIGANTVGQASQAEGELSQALGRLMLVVEQYPDLKANQNFLSLQEELTSTENRIGFARQHYNDTVMGYNTKLQSVPTNLIAGLFNFQEAQLFEITSAEEREAPKVSFT